MAGNKEKIELALKRFDESYTYDEEDRAEAIDDLKFAWNFEKHQWPKDVREKRENDPHAPRPCLVLNKIPEKIDVIEGEFRQSRPNANIIPVDSKADPVIAEINGGIIKHIEYDSSAQTIYNNAYSFLLHSGRTAWRVNTKKNEFNPFEKDLCIEPITNPFTVYFDPYAKKADKSDGKFCFITELMQKEEFEKKYPKANISDEFWRDDKYENWRSKDAIRIAEYWYVECEEEPVYMVERTAEDGQVVKLIVTEEQKQEGDNVVDETTQEKRRVYHCKMTGEQTIEDPKEWKGKYIPIIFILGKSLNIDGKQRSRGMVRHAKDPQRMYNYWASTNTEQLALAPKAPYILSAKMIQNYKGMWDTAGQKNWPYLVYEPDPSLPGGMPQRSSPPLPAVGLINEMTRLEHDIMAAMGIYGSSLGDEGDEKSGIAIQSRQRQGNISTYAYVEAMEIGITYTVKILLNLIPYVYDTERVVRIRGEDDAEKMVPINARPELNLAGDYDKDMLVSPKPGISQYINDVTIGAYDVRVKIGPSYTSQREEAVEKLFNILSAAPNLIPATIDILVKNIDVPGSQELMERLEKLIPAGLKDPEEGEEVQQQPTPEQVQAMMEQQSKQMEQQFKQFELFLKEREQERKEFETQVNAITSLVEAEAKERGQQIEAMRVISEQIRAGMSRPEQ